MASSNYLSRENISTLWNLIKQNFASNQTATQSENGLMSAQDKKKLDNISETGQNISQPELNQIILNNNGTLKFDISSNENDEPIAYGDIFLLSLDQFSSIIEIHDLSINIPLDVIDVFEAEIGYIEITDFLEFDSQETEIFTDTYSKWNGRFKLVFEQNKIKIIVSLSGMLNYGVNLETQRIRFTQSGTVG